jgi:pimeloyl-ACP methyl ester carboxylesterase
VTLATHELGDPAAPPLVFLHALGVGTSGRYVSEIAPLLRRRVIGVDGAVYCALARARSSEAWPTIDVDRIPTLLVYATEPADRAAENEAGAQRLVRAIGSAEAVPLPGSGHDVIADGGPALAEIVADWLDSSSR